MAAVADRHPWPRHRRVRGGAGARAAVPAGRRRGHPGPGPAVGCAGAQPPGGVAPQGRGGADADRARPARRGGPQHLGHQRPGQHGAAPDGPPARPGPHGADHHQRGQQAGPGRAALGTGRAARGGRERPPGADSRAGAAGRPGRYRRRRRARRPHRGKRPASPAGSGRRPGRLPDRPGGPDQQRPPLRRDERHHPHRLPGRNPDGRGRRRRRPAVAWPAWRPASGHGQRHRRHDRTGGRAWRHASGRPRPEGGFTVRARLPLPGPSQDEGDR